MKKLLISLMLLISLSGNCQSHLKGKIKDYRDGNNIMATSVLVFSLSDTSYKIPFKLFEQKIRTHLNETISDKNGDFLIDNISIKSFNLLISFIGFENLLIKNITFCKKDTIDLGNIYLFRQSLVAGFDEYYPGNLEEIRKAKKTEFSFNYPKNGNNLKMKLEDDIVTISYKEFLKK